MGSDILTSWTGRWARQLAGLAVAAAVTVGCGQEAAAPSSTADASTADGAGSGLATQFPKGFMWGAAIAGFQVDMGCPTLPAAECDDPNSDWYQWITDKELVSDPATFVAGDPPSAGPGFWELWPQYLDGAQKELSLGALRYSLEWSRLFPNAATDKATTVAELDQYADKKAVAAYHKIFAGAKQRNLKLLITLNHYTLPLWIHDGKACHQDLDSCKNKGWLDKERILSRLALFSGWCAKEFGGEVDLWGTINEPFAVVLAGYLLPSKERTNPPGVTAKIEEGLQVAFNMMEAHCRMYDAVHEFDKVDSDSDGKPARVGIVANLAAVTALDSQDPTHVAVVPHADYVYNRAFLNAIIKGEVDRNLDGVIEDKEKRADMKGRMDYIGINYYTQLKVKPQPFALAPDYKLFDFLPDTNLFSNYPKGIYEVAKLAHEYGYPVMITENGTGDAKATSWQNFVQPHLSWLHKAIAEGVKVEGYFYWTLMDNYEWNHGVNVYKMGLYDVDNKTKSFKLSPMGQGYGAAAKANGF